MLDVVRRTIRRYRMLPQGGRVLCALSGGADSVALLQILRELQKTGDLVLAGAAHLNHRLRGADADADEEFCRSFAAALGVPFEAARGEVAERARIEKRSIEDTARAARYEYLAEAAARLSADAIAVAHTRDDQAETFLLRLIRGAGTRGLAGIRPKAGHVIRPLIDVRRQSLRAYAEHHGLTHREDATNADVGIPRNRVRHELIPYLEREFSPGIVEVLAREAATALEDEDLLHEDAIELLPSVVLTNTPVTIDAASFSRLPPALAARVAREALRDLAGGRFIGYDHIRAFLEFIREAADGAALSLPGQQAVRKGRQVVLGPEPPRPARPAGSMRGGRVSKQVGSAGPSVPRSVGPGSASGRGK